MNKLLILLTFLFIPATALSAPAFYISGAANIFIPSDSELKSTDPAIQNGLSQLGVSKVADSFETGFGGSVAIGVQLFKRFRVEGEYSYRTADRETTSLERAGITTERSFVGELETHSLMINGIFDFRNSTRFTPYIGAGVGVNFAEISTPAQAVTFVVPGGTVSLASPSTTVDDSVFAYQFLAGLSYWITRQVVGFVEYKYQGSSDLRIRTIEAEYNAHNIGAGVRVYFGKP